MFQVSRPGRTQLCERSTMDAEGFEIGDRATNNR